ncbi:MAG: hypothetical protein JST85_07860 [Acidobacteria bacterium]|nr:hypothetical protein [Acidobacteriota bacterium]
MFVEIPIEYPNHQSLVEELRGFRTLRELHRSEAFRRHRAYLTELFNTPRVIFCSEAQPRLRDFLRIAQWNIEKGTQFDAILNTLLEHPLLNTADLISINESDAGMNRSGNRFIARELGEALQMHVVFAPVYLELTKGFGGELKLPGENTAALQGNAILSRYPIRHARVIELPVCFDHFAFSEKRIGCRSALAVDVEISHRQVSFATTHLEVRNDPACRTRQVQAILADLAKFDSDAAILAGDFNTNATARGGVWRTLRATGRLTLGNKTKQLQRFAAPQRHESLFDLLAAHDFSAEGFNDTNTTCHLILRVVEEASPMPRWLTKALVARMRRFNCQLDMRLDWIFGRNVHPLTDGEAMDDLTGIESRAPQTISGLEAENGWQVSDHDPIMADIRV